MLAEGKAEEGMRGEKTDGQTDGQTCEESFRNRDDKRSGEG